MSLLDMGLRFAEERESLGYTQAAFARMLDISLQGLRKIEAGESEFKVNALAAAASAGADIQYIVTGIRSKNVREIEDRMGFEQQAIHGSVSGVGFAQSGSNVNIIHTNNHRTTVKAETTPGEQHITLAQRAKLKELVDEVAEKEALLKKSPKAHRAIWAALNKHCQVNTYTLIALDDFEKARKYLYMWLGRLNSSASAPVKDGEAWRKSRYSYIKVNSKSGEDAEALKAYMARKYKAESLTELSNDELEEVYRYVAGRRNKKR